MKKVSMLVTAFLFSVLLPQAAAQAAEQKNVTLSAEEGKAGIEIQIPDSDAGISTLCLRIRIEGETDKTDSEEPLIFVPDEEIDPVFTETRYNEEKNTFTVYLSDTGKLTDRTRFTLGTLVPNSVSEDAYTLKVSVPENGFEFINGEGMLNQEEMESSSVVGLNVNQKAEPDAGTEETPVEEPDAGTEETPVEKPDSGTAENPVTEHGSKAEEDKDDDRKEQIQTVKTGDNTSITFYCVLAGICAAGAGIVLVVRKYRK